MSEQLREGFDTAREEVRQRYRSVEGAMARNPASSVLIGFGFGFGLGLVITTLLGERHRETWAERHLPDPLRHWPHSVQDTLEQLTDSARRLPEALRSRVAGAISGR
jgi:hypothetical protein